MKNKAPQPAALLLHADFILYCVYQLEPGAESSNNVNEDLTLRRNCLILELLMNIYKLILYVKFMTADSYMLNRLRPFYYVLLPFNLSASRISLSACVIVACKGSPSLIRIVLLISLGMTTLPRSSILLTIPVAFIVSFLSRINSRSVSQQYDCDADFFLSFWLPYYFSAFR